MIAVFENHVFVFFDRESRVFETSTKETDLIWERWKRAVIDKQINITRRLIEGFDFLKRPG